MQSPLPTQEFTDSLFSHAFLPLISNPTRLTSYSASLTDNIFSNNFSQNVFSGIVLNNLSDHFPVFAHFHEEVVPHSKQKKIFKRSFNAENLKTFNETLSNTNWSTFLNEVDPNESYDGFINEYSRLYNACFPLKVLKGNQMNKISSPWLTPGLLKSIRKNNRLYKQLIKSNGKSCELQYKAYKNKLNHLIRSAKRSYYDNKFESAKQDLRLTWKLLNEVINKHKSTPSLLLSFKSEGRSITDPVEVADRFCKYFTNIGPNLASAIPTVNTSFRSFLDNNNNTPITLNPPILMNWETSAASSIQEKPPVMITSLCMWLNIRFTSSLRLSWILSIFLFLKVFSRTN